MSKNNVWPRQLFLGVFIAIVIAPAYSQEMDWARQSAPDDGWAGQDGGTKGGADANADHVYIVTTVDQLRNAVSGFRSRIVLIKGLIDASEGRPFSSTGDQKVRGVINVSSNTTIVGLGDDAKVINANFMLERASQVILRNLTIENPCDAGPTFDGSDGPTGNWNSEFDGVSINNGSDHIWIDHVTFTDGSVTNDKLPVVYGHLRECHDGAVDIKQASNYITLSNDIFTLHDKNNLVGHSDNASGDRGNLKVTFHDNLFRDIGQRTPRVRYGLVHVYNNAYIGSKTHKAYPYEYSIGVGVASRVISENNNFAIDGVDSCSGVIKNWGGKTFVDHGSMLNGKPLNADQCGYDGDIGWKPPYAYTLRPTEQVEAYVLAHAGAGKWNAK